MTQMCSCSSCISLPLVILRRMYWCKQHLMILLKWRITATYNERISIMPSILAAHVLFGCNIVSSNFGIGKPTVIKALKNNTVSLASIGESNSSLQLCETEGTNLLLSCYKQKLTPLWSQEGRCGNIIYVKTVHQYQEGKFFLQQMRPSWKTSRRLTFKQQYGKFFSVLTHTHLSRAKYPSLPYLIPAAVAHGVKWITNDLLKIIHCGCLSEHPCKPQRCTCNKSRLTCSVFRECESCVTCCNPWTLKTVAGE